MSKRYSKTTCTVDGCDRNDRVVHGLCGMHYQRMAKHGTTDPVTPEFCTVADCNSPHLAKGLCDKHYRRLRRTGKPSSRNFREYAVGPENTGWVGEDVTYVGAHCRVKRIHGPASDHLCVDCGQPARDWSYDHSDPNEKLSREGLSYSPDPAHYEARCKSCHRIFDSGYSAQRSA